MAAGPLVPVSFYEPMGDGLVEIKIKASKQWRILGYTGPVRHEFTLTMICNHKDNIYEPPEASQYPDACFLCCSAVDDALRRHHDTIVLP
jgi:hypothetical protein